MKLNIFRAQYYTVATVAIQGDSAVDIKRAGQPGFESR
jgi:hypothetical protein